MFINFSNHASSLWSDEQTKAAEIYGPIHDMQFPNVDPHSTKAEIIEMTEAITCEIISAGPSAVLCQGEMSLCYAVVQRLKENGIRVLCATTERTSKTEILEDGTSRKTSAFKFVQFREY